MNASEIRQMTQMERLQAIEALWDALLYDGADDIPAPPWHQSILEQRRERMAEGSATFVTMDELRAMRGR